MRRPGLPGMERDESCVRAPIAAHADGPNYPRSTAMVLRPFARAALSSVTRVPAPRYDAWRGPARIPFEMAGGRSRKARPWRARTGLSDSRDRRGNQPVVRPKVAAVFKIKTSVRRGHMAGELTSDLQIPVREQINRAAAGGPSGRVRTKQPRRFRNASIAGLLDWIRLRAAHRGSPARRTWQPR